MISIKSITIKEFRGIRDLTIDLNGKSFGICGPNGTGKSGVVDALEFALTGNISRLSGEGRGDISLKEHGALITMRAGLTGLLVIRRHWNSLLPQALRLAAKAIKSRRHNQFGTKTG